MDQAAPPATTSYAVPSAARPADTGTPFYNHLMSMIDATASENRRAQPSHDLNAAPTADGPGWLTGHLVASAAVLVVVAAVGGVVATLRVQQTEAPVVAADSSLVKASPVLAVTATSTVAVESPLPSAKPDGSAAVDDQEAEEVKDDGKGMATPGNAIKTVSVKTVPVQLAKPDAPPEAKSADEPLESTGFDVTITKDGSETTPAAEDTPPAEALTPPEDAPGKKAPIPRIETGSIEKGPAATRMARMVSDANMRGGPGRSHAVLAAIPRGAAVELIGCRHWCEVIHDGQRGWVYKDFIGAPETAPRG